MELVFLYWRIVSMQNPKIQDATNLTQCFTPQVGRSHTCKSRTASRTSRSSPPPPPTAILPFLPYRLSQVLFYRRSCHCVFCFILVISLIASAHSSPNTYQVVDAAVDALTSQAPRDRYLVGIDARFLLVWLARLPTVVADLIYARMFRHLVPQGCK